MVRATTCTLIKETPGAHGVFETHTQTERTVFCDIRSISQNEAYQAMAAGLNPEFRVVLAHDFEYQGEKLAEINDVLYKVVRTYATETNGIELTVQRVEGNANV